jgi:hypothetical protein
LNSTRAYLRGKKKRKKDKEARTKEVILFHVLHMPFSGTS